MFIVCFVNPNPILHGFFEIVLSRGWGGGGGQKVVTAYNSKVFKLSKGNWAE